MGSNEAGPAQMQRRALEKKQGHGLAGMPLAQSVAEEEEEESAAVTALGAAVLRCSKF